jgi:hypothetical protein
MIEPYHAIGLKLWVRLAAWDGPRRGRGVLTEKRLAVRPSGEPDDDDDFPRVLVDSRYVLRP